MNRRHGPLIVSVILITVGIVGMVVSAAILTATRTSSVQGGLPAPGERGRAGQAEFSSLGEQIYYTGEGQNGPIDVEWDAQDESGGMMGQRRPGGMRMGCVRCHREDGRGGPIGMMGSGAVAADIRYDTLTSPRVENGEQEEPWSDADIARAVREGIEPSRDRLSSIMPRWKMSAGDMNATIDYLKELDER